MRHPAPPRASAATSAAAKAPKKATSEGYGGAVSSVDPEATKIGLQVLKQGGNAVDAAVATAAALGLTEPFSAGIGGGGYFVVYNAEKGKVQTIDGRETAPKAMPTDAFIDPATGKPYNFTPELVTSGVSVGVPGTPLTWERALEKWGTWSLGDTLQPSIDLAREGFKVDKTFRQQTLDNEVRFKAFTSTKKLYLKGGDAPAVGSLFKQQGPRRHLRAARRQGPAAALPRRPRRRDRPRRADASHDHGDDAPRPAGLPEEARPARLPRARAEADQGRLPRLRRLRHGAVLQRRLDRR